MTTPFQRLADFARRVVNVPKAEIEAQEKKYRRRRAAKRRRNKMMQTLLT